MVDKSNYGDKPTDEELRILVGLLKPGKKLPPLTNFFYPADYAEQLIAENYLKCFHRNLTGFQVQ